MIDMS
jgi:threonyl-tRNA synthetase